MELLSAKRLPRSWSSNDLNGVKTVIHCGAYGNHSFQKNRSEIFKVNVENTFNLLNISRDMGVKNFVFLGSSSEYGEKQKIMSETDTPETYSDYGCTKVCGTYLTRMFSKYMNTVTIRPFSIYGEKEAIWRFIPVVILNALTGKCSNVCQAWHDWIHLDDFCSGVLTVIKNIEELNGQIVNIGTGNQHSNFEVVEIIEKTHGKKIDVNKVDNMRFDDKKMWVADNTKLLSYGWSDKISLESGIKKVYEFIKQNN